MRPTQGKMAMRAPSAILGTARCGKPRVGGRRVMVTPPGPSTDVLGL